MFLSDDDLPMSASNWMEQYKKVPKKPVNRAIQRKQSDKKADQMSDRYQLEVALREAEEKYRNTFENAVEGIFQTTPDGRFLSANPALSRIYGYSSPAELIASLTDIGQQLYVDPHRRQEFIEKMYSFGSISGFESQIYRQDKTIIWISESARVVRNEKGEIVYYEGFVSDVTVRKVTEESLRRSEANFRLQTEELELVLNQLQKTQCQLIQSEKLSSLGELVAGIAHEINNPVNFVCGNLNPASQYMKDLIQLVQTYAKFYPQPVPEIQEKIEDLDLDFIIEDFPKTMSSMKIGTDRISQIVQSLRTFSRIDEEKMKPSDIHEGLDSTLLILNNRLKASGSNPGITVLKEYGDLPPVVCYSGLLNQVFMNLLSNAIDVLEEYNEKEFRLNNDPLNSRPATIRIRTEVRIQDSPYAVIRIADNGHGMTEAVRERVFEAFFTTKPVGKGTGLGLSISHQIITEKHRGQLSCISAPEQGTEFIIEIPIQV